MDNAIDHLEASIEKTGGKIVTIKSIINEIEGDDNAQGKDDSEAVIDLLETVKQVKTDCQNFQKNLTEVKELQRQVQYALQCSNYELQQAFTSLRIRMLENHIVYPNDLANLRKESA